MTDRTTPVNLGAKLMLPFLVGDLLLLVAALVIWQQAERPMTGLEVGAFAGCIAFGAWLGVWPFRLRYEAELKLTQTAALTDTLRQIGEVEHVAARIDAASGQWQTLQEHAARTTEAAREILDRMTVEHREFRTFLDKAEDAERNHLRLEVNKLRRAEGDWLQVLVRMLDHVYALYQAGVHSGQSRLIEQFTHFQNACRDVVRRVGMVVVVGAPEAPFDPELHQLPDPNAAPPPGATVLETLATGYAFQGQLLRRAVVALRAPPAAATAVPTVESFSTQPPAAAPSEAGEAVPSPDPTLVETTRQSNPGLAPVPETSAPDPAAASGGADPAPPATLTPAMSPAETALADPTVSPASTASPAGKPAPARPRRRGQTELLP
jgi:molecular chaperone GrpE (heat shock protein)